MSSGFPQHNFSLTAKLSNNTPQSSLAVHQSGNSSAGIESSRRSGGGGAAAAARSNQALPRNSQSGKKSHKNHRKPNTPIFDDSIEEQVAMASAGGNRRGTSITHLMNWNLPPRHHDHYPRNRNTYRRNPTWGLGSGYHAVDKARFVNANYRFIVDPRGDYRAQSVDSDVHLSWEKVLQVLVSAKSQTASCPICLSVPVAARMAKCGHIFCLPCLMRYMSVVEEGKPPIPDKRPKYKKCPICWDTIYMSDVRPVRWFTGQEGEVLQDGMEVVLRLMARPQGTTLALPRDVSDALTDTDGIPWHFSPEVADYARLMKGTKDYMQDQMKQEIEDLKVMGREDQLMFNEEGEWTRKAISTVKSAMEYFTEIDNIQPPKAVVEEPKPLKPEMKVNENSDDVPDMYHVLHAARSGQLTLSPHTRSQSTSENAPEAAPPRISIPDDRKIKPGEASVMTYYFYRALPHYYLAPLDIQILKAAFGPFDSFPPTVLPRVENVTRGHTIDDDFRKKRKYLAHLPAGTEVAFLECDWTGVIPSEILEKFKPEIERRRKKKKDKELQEERDRIRAEKEESENIWALERQRRKAAAGGEGNQGADYLAMAITESQRESGPELTVTAGEGLPPLSSPPLLPQASATTQSESPNTYRTVWGTTAIAADPRDLLPPPTQRPHDDDGWLDGWERAYVIEEDLRAHLARTPGQNPMGVGKGASKKNKKVTLMTNGGKRGA